MARVNEPENGCPSRVDVLKALLPPEWRDMRRVRFGFNDSGHTRREGDES